MKRHRRLRVVLDSFDAQTSPGPWGGCLFLGMLLFFGVFINASYDIWFKPLAGWLLHSWRFDWNGAGRQFVEGLPFLVMLGVMAIVVYFYYRYNPRRRLRPAPPDVSPGLILALSLLAIRPGSPFQSVEDLNTALNTPDKTLGRRLFESNWGPMLAAVECHKAALRHCWVLCTSQALQQFETAERAIRWAASSENSSLVCVPVILDEGDMIGQVVEKVRSIYSKADEFGLQEMDILADLTGGTKEISCGVVIATLEAERRLQYLRQGESLLLNGEPLTAAQIREKGLFISPVTNPAIAREAIYS